MIMYSQSFLKQLDEYPHKEKYIRLVVFDCYGNPRETLHGRATGGSLSFSGKSKMQRTCSISLVTEIDDNIITNEYWALQNTFSLSIGLKNEINSLYEDIIWFEQGVYVISSFSYNISTSSITISISGKDKISRLDGTAGGRLGSQVTFDHIEEEDEDGTITDIKIPLRDIIKYAVMTYGKESQDKIIIRDLDIRGYELWEYNGDEPMYLLINELEQVITAYFSGDGKVYVEDKMLQLKNIPKYYVLNPMNINYNVDATQITTTKAGKTKYYVVKIEHGQPIGYHETDLIYPEDLILKANNTVTDLLDKIVTLLGQYEYFYDEKGNFIFQKQQQYLKTSLNLNEETFMSEPTFITKDYVYEFKDLSLFTALGVNPQIANIKNDYFLWGERKSPTGMTYNPHIRYAIDKKPDHDYKSLPYTNIKGTVIPSKTYRLKDWDWRELIYQMSCDYRRHSTEKDFLQQVEKLNPWAIGGITGYEQYYVDMSLWRDLYNPSPLDEDKNKFYPINSAFAYWNKDIHQNPGNLNFWFDFLDTEGEWNNISVSKIGNRQHVEELKFQSIYSSTVPELQFILEGETVQTQNAYQEIVLSKQYEGLFNISSTTDHGLTLLADRLNKYTDQANTLSATIVPIYYLQPNQRVRVEGYGDYVITSISHSLTANATMTLQLSKILTTYMKGVT